MAWWNWFASGVATTWNDIRNFIHDAIKAAVDLLDEGLNFVVYVFTTVTNGLSAALGVIGNYATVAWQWVSAAAETVGSWIDHATVWLWDNVIYPAIRDVANALDFAVGILQYALAQAAAGLSWLVDNIVAPAWDWIVHAAETVGRWIEAAVAAFYNDVIEPVFHFFGDVANIVGALWDWFVHDAAVAVEAVLQALDWIVWLGAHSFEELLGLLEGAGGALGRDWVLANAKDPEGWSHKIADDLARILA